MNSRRLFQLDPDSGLSSDLEYLLDSGEAGETQLAGALISETYHAGCRLARFFFGETPAAQQALMDAWAAALASAYSYRPGTGACTWFYRLALAVFRRERDQAAYPPAGPPRPANPATPDGVQAGLGPAFEALDEETRLACAMGCALDWPAGDIAAILQEPEGQTRLRLDRGRSAARQAPGPEGKPASDPEEGLRLGFQARWPAPEPLAPGRLAELAARAAAQARRQMDRSRRRAYLGEIVLVAAAILLAFGLFRGASRFAPEATPTPQPALPPTPTPASPARYAIYPVQPGDSLQSIAERVGMTVDELSRINSIPLGAYRPASRELKITFPGLPDAAPAPGGPEPLLPPLTAASTGEEVRR
ncbi:MAG TPA: LysM peptidoglycan-binding domain-containing protein, partial [Anaerolineales bacterium]